MDKYDEKGYALWASLRETDFHDGRNLIIKFSRELAADEVSEALDRFQTRGDDADYDRYLSDRAASLRSKEERK